MYTFYIISVILSAISFIYLSNVDKTLVKGIKEHIKIENDNQLYMLVFMLILIPILNTLFAISLLKCIIIYHNGN